MTAKVTFVWFDLARREMLDEHGATWAITEMIDADGFGTADPQEAVSVVGYLGGDGIWAAVDIRSFKPAEFS